MCSHSCRSSKVERHYESEHGISVGVSMLSTAKKLPSPREPSPLTELSDMEEDDPPAPPALPSPAAPSIAPEAMDESSDPETDEDDEWEEESAFSDASTEIMLGEDDDDIVPSSFNFPTSSDGEPPASIDRLEPPPEAEEDPSPPSSRVFASESQYWCPYSLRDVSLT
jgi:hypothetical protein